MLVLNTEPGGSLFSMLALNERESFVYPPYFPFIRTTKTTGKLLIGQVCGHISLYKNIIVSFNNWIQCHQGEFCGKIQNQTAAYSFTMLADNQTVFPFSVSLKDKGGFSELGNL